jgi:hypothetical protein
MIRWALRSLALLGLLALAGGLMGFAPAEAQSGPSIRLDRPEAAPGEPFLVTFDGFDAPFVNVVVCGNLAYRGAADCNMTAGVSKETEPNGPRTIEMVALPPPIHCPCIVRATASTGGDFAVAPIVITGFPVGDLEGVPEGPLVEVEVEPHEANDGVWATIRSALGGPTRYEATVSVRNRTTETLTQLALTGSVAHWLDDDAAVLALEAPAALEPGQTWTQEVVAEVSAPTVGNFQFDVVAAGAGASVTGSSSVSRQPVLLWVLVLILVVDVVVAVGRWIGRRSRRRQAIEAELYGGYDEEADEADLIEVGPPSGGAVTI